MSLARMALSHLKAILFIALALCAVGAWTIFSFPVSILPDITFPRIVAIADVGDRPARMVEVTVSRPLEEAIATVPGVSRVCGRKYSAGRPRFPPISRGEPICWSRSN